MSDNIISLVNIEKYYPLKNKQKFHALKNVNLNIEKGEIFGIIGRSGAGKSTLIRLLNLLERPDSGQVIIDGKNIVEYNSTELNKYRQKVGMVFQNFNLLANKTIVDNVILPLKIAGVEKEQAHARAIELLKLVGLEEHLSKYPAQLSGGQRQRVGIARALANGPNILLCDEATSALDPETTQSILELLKQLRDQLNLTIVMITHSMDVIRTACDRVAVINAGELVEVGNVIDVFLHPRTEITKSLLSETGFNENYHLLDDKYRGYIIRLTYRGDEIAKPIISHISTQLGLEASILQGVVSNIGSVHYGQLVVNVDCSPEQYKQLESLLKENQVDFELLNFIGEESSGSQA